MDYVFPYKNKEAKPTPNVFCFSRFHFLPHSHQTKKKKIQNKGKKILLSEFLQGTKKKGGGGRRKKILKTVTIMWPMSIAFISVVLLFFLGLAIACLLVWSFKTWCLSSKYTKHLRSLLQDCVVDGMNADAMEDPNLASPLTQRAMAKLQTLVSIFGTDALRKWCDVDNMQALLERQLNSIITYQNQQKKDPATKPNHPLVETLKTTE